MRSAHDDTDAAGVAWRPSTVFIALAAGLVAGVVVLAWMSHLPRTSDAVVAAASSAAAPSTQPTEQVPAATAAIQPAPRPVFTGHVAAGAGVVRPVSRQRDAGGDPSPDLSDFVTSGDIPTAALVIDRLHQAGIYSGLGAFTPPGTRPPLLGLAVPEDFDLPAGYVRHYQATDDGQRIEPILMFSPDVQWVDEAGRPIAIPADRVVPPDMAPPGLPIRHIAVPAPVDTAWRGR